ncbi:MAG: energy transducer TonB [Acidobacteriota bacterium]|nr:energy transducer TonB [Acidobacteriota bacterium]
MRRMTLTTLLLVPVMAHAQANTAVEPQPFTSSAMVAGLAQPAELAMNTAVSKAAPAASMATIHTSTHAAVHESVQSRMTENFVDAALLKGGTLEYAMMGSVPTESSAPKVTRAVEVSLSDKELEEQPAVSHVVLHAIVDVNGIPRNVAVTHSAGSVIDRKAIEAVSQYRFTPATLDNKPTWSTVSIAIKIQKP